MKKLLAITGIFLLLSCQDDSDETVYNTHEDVYVTQMTQTEGGTSATHTYTYDGNKLLTDTDTQGYERQYSYVNDLLTLEEVYLNAELVEYTIFSYTFDKKLAQAIHITSNGDGTWYGFKNRFVYTDDNNLTIAQYDGDEDGQYNALTTGTLTYSEGNIATYSLTPIDEDEDEDDDIEPTPVVTTLTYTNSKAPFKNVFCYEALCLAHLEGGPNTVASVTVTEIIEGEDGPEEQNTTVTYTYQEGANGYPAQQTGDNGTSKQFTY
jgi:hypothetical protein